MDNKDKRWLGLPKASSDTEHKRKHVIRFDHRQLERLVAFAASECVEHLMPDLTAPGVTYKVVFEEATEGSPAYRIGTKATVTITEDLCPQVADA